MSDTPKISDAEWEVMKVLWERSPQTSTEIIETIKEKIEWSPKTIHTLISRLVKKGAVSVDKKGSNYEYSADVEQDEVIRAETKSFVNKLYNGSVHMLIANFLKDEHLLPEEIDELKRILEDKKK